MKPAALGSLCLLLAACDPATTFRSCDGQREGHGRKVANKNDGPWTLFGPGGARIGTGRFANGTPVGIWKQFHANGALQERATLRDGVRHGEAATFDDRGARLSIGRYENGVPCGAWIFWDSDGQVDAARTGPYVAGVRRE
jgi:antitoxin component YwqK of YwqJK toxin-antitoxin module